ncbi:MAG: tRNA (adenosine(37)-N6)-threonylcarbamoyltransferase complex dimerization subunit type 1 TsaB [Chloroflexi bacterium]|nr:tRNA (adenosine(37)-N6)-threonylcarbamoyltransferase complex dimerization subunit type 1 TsaB [Chloroflexota bacterium]
MTLLALDTSTRAMGLALYDGVQVLYESIWQTQNYHTVELAPAIQKALLQSGVSVVDLQALAIAIGPGSYTGLRIGLALSKGLSFARRLPLIPIPTLDVIAAGQPIGKVPLAALLQAGRGRLAVGMYAAKDERWRSQGEASLKTLEEFATSISEPTLICGELGEEEYRVLGRKRKNALIASPAHNVRRPSLLAELAWERFETGEFASKAGLGPSYLQSDQAIAA